MVSRRSGRSDRFENNGNLLTLGIIEGVFKGRVTPCTALGESHRLLFGRAILCLLGEGHWPELEYKG